MLVWPVIRGVEDIGTTGGKVTGKAEAMKVFEVSHDLCQVAMGGKG
jgi:hypothetical protein